MLLKLTKISDGQSLWFNSDHIVGLYNSGDNPNGATVMTSAATAHSVKEPVSAIAKVLGGAICVTDEIEKAAALDAGDEHQ